MAGLTRWQWEFRPSATIHRLRRESSSMRSCLVLLLLLSTEFASSQQKKEEEHPFPTKYRIQLLLTQSERAFDVYEQTMKQEAQVGDDWKQAVAKDEEVLTNARDLLARLKTSPDGFNTPVGFLLVGGLQDASRNMSVCMGQAGMLSAAAEIAGNAAEGQRYLRLVQACLDASTLLYTVSETAFDMYSEYLLAEDQMSKKAMSTLDQCVAVLKKNPEQKK